MTKPSEKDGIIYALLDPRKTNLGFNGACFYVGIIYSNKQSRLKRRLLNHIYDCKKHREKNITKERKIKKILNAGLRPIIVSLHIVPISEIKKHEQFYISLFRSIGIPLTNISGGGDWNPMVDGTPEEIKNRIDKSKAGVKSYNENRIKKELEELGMTNEERLKYKHNINKNNFVERHTNNNVNILAEYTAKHRNKLKESMGKEAFKKHVAKKKREWYASLSEERKVEQRKKDSEYRKRKRAERKSALQKNNESN